MRFETILDAYRLATMEALLYFIGDDPHDKIEHKRHTRQRDAFRARLLWMYREMRDEAELYRQMADPLPDEYWRTEMMEDRHYEV